ncbi:MAG: Nre family DNA repair protein [Candidatus Bathyarchaeia archaeon]
MLIKRVKKKRLNRSLSPWLSNLIDDYKVAGDLEETFSFSTKLGSSACAVCKGSRLLCGKTRCPLLLRLSYYLKTMPMIRDRELSGSSPPSVFVGRIGYPYVHVGPLVPPINEDTTVLDIPEFWFGKSMEEIVGFRSMLVRGMYRVNVKKMEGSGRILDLTRDLALSSFCVNVDLKFNDKPKKRIILSDDIQPFGPSAVINDMDIEASKWDERVEKVYYDDDLRASDAVIYLYNEGVLISRIQRAFSVGAFGLEKQRRLVPTRWSITAVDSISSNYLINKVRRYPEINEFRVYESTYLDNRFEVLMIPSKWSYESIEAWYPGTIWNPYSQFTVLLSDWEGYDGRSEYAKIGGCYYSARLAVAEKLEEERRQASVVVLREARPGYIMPVGVWQVRENVRNAVRQKPLKFNSLEEALTYVGSRFRIPMEKWVENSNLLKFFIQQKRITDYLKQLK